MTKAAFEMNTRNLRRFGGVVRTNEIKDIEVEQLWCPIRAEGVVTYRLHTKLRTQCGFPLLLKELYLTNADFSI